MLEVASLRIYGYDKPLKNKKGEVIGEVLDIKGDLRLPNEVLRALGIELREGKYSKPIIIEIRKGFVVMKKPSDEHDDFR